jgi:CBS domain-containing protein
MPVLEVQRRVKARGDMVWRIVSDLGGDACVPPTAGRVEVIAGEGLGMTRRVVGRDGFAWEEECVSWEPGRRYSVRIDPTEFPLRFAQLRYTCSVLEESDQVRLRLYFDYLPRFGFVGRLLERFSHRRGLASYAHQIMDNWVRLIHAREWAHRVTASSLLEEKGGYVHSVTPATTVSAAAAMLREHRIGSVLVLDADQTIAGMVSERDIVRGLAEQGAALLEQSVALIMTREVIVASPEDNMMLVMASMSDHRIRHLPVVGAGETLGVISIGDVIRARLVELEGQSETLRGYIEARRWHELYQEIGPAAYASEQMPKVS